MDSTLEASLVLNAFPPTDIYEALVKANPRSAPEVDRVLAAAGTSRFRDPRDRAAAIVACLTCVGSTTERALFTALALHC